MRRRARILLALLALAVLASAPAAADPNDPIVLDPPQSAALSTSRAYVRVEVMAGQTFEVWLELEGESPEDVTSAFSFASSAPSSREIHHAQLEVPLGDHELWVVQNIASPPATLPSATRSFARIQGAVRELGPVDDAGGDVLGAILEGAVERSSGASWLLFGPTTVAGPTILPSAQAGSTDADASDGIDLTWYAEPSPLAAVLTLATAGPGDNDEEDVWLTAPFERGSDVFAFYQRVDRDATPIQQGLGLAKATGAALPFTRLTFAAAQPPGGGHFDDLYSIFQASEFPRVRAVVPSGSYVLLFGQREGGSGLPADREIVLARAPLSTVEDRSTYQYWTEVAGVRAWRSSATGSVVLFKNASAPSVAWSVELGRWLATSTQEQGALAPYGVSGARSAIQLRVADDPRGPWSPANTIWRLPAADAAADGTALEAIHLAGFDDGDFAYLAATDASDSTSPPLVNLYEVDLPAAGLPAGPVAPVIVTPSGSTSDNPFPVEGYAAPGDTVRLTINGTTQWFTASPNSDGRFTISAALYDGANTITATATRNGLASPASSSISITYANDDVHTLNDTAKRTISLNTVWTPGSGPYVVSGGNLAVNAGVYLVLQPGVQVQFQSGRGFVVVGELRIQGTSASPVKLGPTGVANPLACTTTPGWEGIDVNNSALGGTGIATIEWAQIGCAARGIEVIGDVATIRDVTIYQSQTYGISITGGGTATIERVTIDRSTNGGSAGIEMTSAGATTVDACTIRRSADGIRITSSSPIVRNSLFEANTNGIKVAQGSTPEITGNTVRSNTSRGVWVSGNNTAAQDPLPEIHENDIYDNATINLIVEFFGDTTRLVDVAENWWGSSDLVTLSGKILDASDSGGSNRPFAGFAPWLDASITAGGEPVPGTFLNGPVSGALVPGEPYEVVGKVLVPAGALSTLVIQAGSELRFHPKTSLEAKGRLTVAGTLASPVQFRSVKATPLPGDWEGIKIAGAGAAGSIIEHALVEHAYVAVEIESTWATVRESVIREFGRTSESAVGVLVDGEGGETDPKSTIRANTITKTASVSLGGYGIQVDRASPTIEANEIRQATYGLYVNGQSSAALPPTVPVVTGNRIEDNGSGVRIGSHCDGLFTENVIVDNTQIGVQVVGLFDAARDPRPVFHRNEIHGNGAKDATAASFANPASTVLDFEENWWGTTDLGLIAAHVTDYSDASGAAGYAAVVDFAPPLDGPAGAPIAGNFLSGPTAPGTSLAPGTYQVVGALTVPAGETLVVQGGARLEFLSGAAFRVLGALDVQGGPANLATFTATGVTPTPGSWDGVYLDTTADGSKLDYARIEYATRGVELRADGVQITNCEIGHIPASGYGIYATNVAAGTVAGNTLDNLTLAQGTGIELVDATLAIDANTIRGFSTGLTFTRSGGTVTQNLIEDNSTRGIRINSGTSAAITNDNEITGNGLGIYIAGNNVAADNPTSVIHGNWIHDNTGFELSASFYGSSSTATVDAILNYWGTTSPTTIGGHIQDRTDAGTSNAPTVTFTPYLDANMNPVSGSYLNGTLAADLTLASGTTWDVVGDLVVPTGRTLTIQSGATLRFAASTALRVAGTLDVNGTSGQRVLFTSDQTTPSQSTWDGIRITGGSSTIDYAKVQYADRSIDVRDAAVDVRDSEIFDFGRAQASGPTYVGIYYEDATGTIDGNLVEQHGAYLDRGTGIQLFGAAPTVSDNTIHDAGVGLIAQGPSAGSPSVASITGNHIYGNHSEGVSVRDNARPVITANVITANQVGVEVVGVAGYTLAGHDPDPVVNGNDLAGNTFKDFRTTMSGNPDGPPLNAEGNWWGYTTVQQVADRVFDATTPGYYARYVDFTPFLDASIGSGGDPVAGNYLVGTLAGGTTLTDAAPYEVTGPLRVAPGTTVTIEAGAILEFPDHSRFEVEGTLLIEGTSADPVLLTSSAASGPGDWMGIEIQEGSTGSSIAHARIEYAFTAIDCTKADVTVTDSEIEFFEVFGIRLFDDCEATIDGNLIRDGSKSAVGILFHSSTGHVTANEIRDNNIGIDIQQGSSPTIDGGNTITSNRTGIRITGGYYWLVNPSPNPAPVIHGNNIYANYPVPSSSVLQNLEVQYFWYPGTQEKIDVRENWWGSSNPADIQAGFKIVDKNQTVIDYSGRLDGLDGNPIAGLKFNNILTNVRHNAQVFRPASSGTAGVQFDLLAPGTVDFIVYHEDDATLSTPIYTGSQNLDAGPHQFNWDGRDNAGSYQDDGAYRYVLKGDGGTSGNYDPFVGEVPQIGALYAGEQTPTFNAFEGEPWKRPITITDSSRRVSLWVQPEGKPGFFTFDRACYVPSATPQMVSWDGFTPEGEPVVGHVYLNIHDLNRNVTPNHVVISDIAPMVRIPGSGPPPPGPVPGPTVTIRSNPAVVYHSYDQFTKLTYDLDRSSTVTVKLLPPGIVDPNDPAAIPLVTAQAQSAGEHTVTWLGHDGLDTNAILTATEGAYVFVVHATSTLTGKSSTTRAALLLRK